MIDLIRAELKFLGEGNSRSVYLSRSGKYVFKVAKDVYGNIDNIYEHDSYSHNISLGRERMARCRLFGNVLVMEYVKPVFGCKHFPDWVLSVDCQQVGYNKKGELVAYDYA